MALRAVDVVKEEEDLDAAPRAVVVPPGGDVRGDVLLARGAEARDFVAVESDAAAKVRLQRAADRPVGEQRLEHRQLGARGDHVAAADGRDLRAAGRVQLGEAPRDLVEIGGGEAEVRHQRDAVALKRGVQRRRRGVSLEEPLRRRDVRLVVRSTRIRRRVRPPPREARAECREGAADPPARRRERLLAQRLIELEVQCALRVVREVELVHHRPLLLRRPRQHRAQVDSESIRLHPARR
mmetsp:Transcript_2495/g.6198  ORF Transcript_2495/g.6198 Transcript_2495/m.6198 type:complete len:239 (-) Transcript_2495:348-1064(-)